MKNGSKRWLITGGMGFIGTNLINEIRGRFPDDQIVIVDNLQARSTALLTDLKNIDIYIQDISSISSINVYNVDYFIHLAAETDVRKSMANPKESLMSNYNNLICCLNYALELNVKKFIFASSAGCVGNNPIPLDEQSSFNPVSPYAASKLCGEIVCGLYSKLGLKTVSLRFSNIYGIHSNHKHSVVISFMKSIKAGKQITIYGDGKQTRDFIYVDDVVLSIIKSATKNVEGTFCISSNIETSINELIEIIELSLNMKARRISLMQVDGEIANSLVNNTKAVKDLQLSWNNTINLNEGIKKIAKWLERN